MQLSELSTLIAALSKLFWPAFALSVALIFRKDISLFLRRVRKGKIFGQEFELAEESISFKNAVEKAQREALPEARNSLVGESISARDDLNERRLLEAAKADIRLGIIRLARMIEYEVFEIASASGSLASLEDAPTPQRVANLAEKGYLPKNTTHSLQVFWEIRNKVVHDAAIDATTNLWGILDSGLVLLNTLRAIPRERNIVFESGVRLYSDPQCNVEVDSARGLILETTSPGKAMKSLRIFPTTRSEYYTKGMRVSWEWDLSKVWPATWYINPEDNLPTQAWISAGEFHGRNVDELRGT